MVPTSAITGDGMGDLIALLITFSLKMLRQQLMLSMELEALVLEVEDGVLHVTDHVSIKPLPFSLCSG